MQDQSAITITNELSLYDMQRAGDLPYGWVLDLRFANSDARPIEEEVLLRLRNLQVEYEQLPIDMHQIDSQRKNELVRRITADRSAIMVLTDQPEALRALCSNLDMADILIARDAGAQAPVAPYKLPATAGFAHSEAA